MPRRYYDYLPQYEFYHALSTYGSWVLAAGLFLIMFYMIASLINGKKAGLNPWGALTLEWTHTTTPPDHHNFHDTPVVTRGAYDFHLAKHLFEHGGEVTELDLGGDGSAATPEEAPVPNEPVA
jgi:cytochrome c oxidase subunit 1